MHELPTANEIFFRMVVKSHFQLTADLAEAVHVVGIPRWPFADLVIRHLEDGTSELVFAFDTNLLGERSAEEWMRFSEAVAAAISYCACVPLTIIILGVITKMTKPGQYSQTSLAPGNSTGALAPLAGPHALVRAGNAQEDHQAVCLSFFWQALSSMDPLYRFINLVICYEVWMGFASKQARSMSPVCKNLECKTALTNCPACEEPWGKIPTPLGLHLHEVIQDTDIETKFIHGRNRVFHASASGLDKAFRDGLPSLNAQLLLHFRNATRDWFGVPAITGLCLAVDPPLVSVTVYFTPNNGSAGTPAPS